MQLVKSVPSGSETERSVIVTSVLGSAIASTLGRVISTSESSASIEVVGGLATAIGGDVTFTGGVGVLLTVEDLIVLASHLTVTRGKVLTGQITSLGVSPASVSVLFLSRSKAVRAVTISVVHGTYTVAQKLYLPDFCSNLGEVYYTVDQIGTKVKS